MVTPVSTKMRFDVFAARRLVLWAAVAVNAAVLAANFTYEWADGQTPSSALDGKVTFTYGVESGVSRISKIDISIADGDTLTFTGGTMRFLLDKASSVTMQNSSMVVFQNEVETRTLNVTTAASAKRDRTWNGYETFIGTEWTTVFENAKLDDAQLVPIKQYEYKGAGSSENIPNWSNRGITLKPCHIKRGFGSVSCIYQGNWGASSTYVACIWAEFRQNGSDIQMRITDAGWVLPLDAENIFVGVDPDTLCGRYTWNHHLIRTTGNANSGCGMNTVKIQIMNAACRFENTVTFNGSPTPQAGVRMEFADPTKVSGTPYFVPYDNAEIALQDASKDASGWYFNGGAGTVIFETTKPTASPAETNCIEITSAFDEYYQKWKTPGKVRVRGIEGSPMILKAKHPYAYPTNGLTVEAGGILEMTEGEGLYSGVRNGKCAITVNKGGVLRQSGSGVFATNQVLTVNGGTIELGFNKAAGDVKSRLYQVTLRDGARIVAASDQFMLVGGYTKGTTWFVGGASPSTNEAPLVLMGPGGFAIATNTFNVAQTGGGVYDADFVTTAAIDEYGGTDQYKTNVLRKIGLGTFRFDAAYKVPGWVELEQGFIKLGKSDLWGTANKKATINFRGGGLRVAAGTTNAMGKIKLCENGSIIVEDGATLTFPDQSAVAWEPGKILDFTIPVADGAFGATVQFASASALTPAQRNQIRVNGKHVTLDGSGRFAPLGMIVVIK